MTVSELIKILSKMPQESTVAINDVPNGIFHEIVDGAFFDKDEETNESFTVIMIV